MVLESESPLSRHEQVPWQMGTASLCVGDVLSCCLLLWWEEQSNSLCSLPKDTDVIPECSVRKPDSPALSPREFRPLTWRSGGDIPFRPYGF